MRLMREKGDDGAGGGRSYILVVGYGNELRRDDALGVEAAVAVADWGMRGVESVPVQQLLPETAAYLAGCDAVIFIDASVEEENSGVRVRRLSPGDTIEARAGFSCGHLSGPLEVIAIADGLFGFRPEAWLMEIRGFDFGFGHGLSVYARKNLRIALDRIEFLINEIQERQHALSYA